MQTHPAAVLLIALCSGAGCTAEAGPDAQTTSAARTANSRFQVDGIQRTARGYV